MWPAFGIGHAAEGHIAGRCHGTGTRTFSASCSVAAMRLLTWLSSSWQAGDEAAVDMAQIETEGMPAKPSPCDVRSHPCSSIAERASDSDNEDANADAGGNFSTVHAKAHPPMQCRGRVAI